MTKRPFSPPLHPLLHAYLAEQARWQRLTAVSSPHPTPHSLLQQQPLPTPYRPLTPFTRHDAPLFFGRDAVTQRLVATVTSQPLVALLGESGSGKSSLIHAGLLPQLDPTTWQTMVVTLAERPFLTLAHAILNHLPQPHTTSEANQLAAALASQTITLADLLAHFNRPYVQPKRWLIIVDQLETVLPPGSLPAPTLTLFDHLLGTLTADSGSLVTLLLAFRSDALGTALRYPPLAVALYAHDLQLTPLSQAALTRACEQPAARFGIFLENGLTQRLRDDIGTDLPLLQLTLATLWEGRENGRLTHQSYESHGTASGIVTRHAAATLAQLPTSSQPAALSLLRQLATDPTPFPLTMLPAENLPWVQTLIACRLLVSGEDATAQPVIRLAAPHLLADWPPLQPHQPATPEPPQAEPVPITAPPLPDTTPRLPRKRRLARLTPLFGLLLLLLLALGWLAANTLQSGDDKLTQATAEAAQATVEVEVAQAMIAEFEPTSTAPATEDLAETVLNFTPDETLLLAYETVTRARAVGSEPAAAAVGRLYQALLMPVNRGVLLGHTGWVTHVAYSPNGEMLLTVGADNTARLWGTDGRLLATLDGHHDWVTNALFSPDGQTILTTSDDGTARLWDTSGQQLQLFDGHEGGIETAVFSPDGQQIVTVGSDGFARIWQRDGRLLVELEHLAGVSAVAFSPDGQQLATGSSDGQLWLWETNGRPQDVVAGHHGRIHAITYAPDGNSLATVGSDGTLRLWDRNADSLGIVAGHTDAVWTVDFSPDGSTILTASSDGTARLWNWEGDVLAVMRHSSWVVNARFTLDGNQILTAGGDGLVRLWNRSGELLGEFVGHTDGVTDLALAPNGVGLASSSRDGTARLWRLDEAATTVLARLDDWVTQTAVSPDGQRLAVAGRNGVIMVWKRDGQQVARLPGHTALVTALAFSPNGRLLVSSSRDGSARVWTSDGELVTTLAGHADAVESVVFSPDGSQLLTGSTDGTARLWDTEGNLLATLADNGGAVHAVAFVGSRLATAGADGQLRLWRKDGRLAHTLSGHTAPVLVLASSPDGRQLASSSQDGTARLWDADGKLLATFTGHGDWVNDVAFRPDGSQLLTASSDGTARLWQVDGTLLATLSGHTGLLYSAQFSQDGNLIVTASRDGTARLWNSAGEPLLRLDGHQDVVESAVFDPQGQFVLTSSRDGTARRWPIYTDLTLVLAEIEAHLRPLLNATTCSPTLPCPTPSE